MSAPWAQNVYANCVVAEVNPAIRKRPMSRTSAVRETTGAGAGSGAMFQLLGSTCVTAPWGWRVSFRLKKVTMVATAHKPEAKPAVAAPEETPFLVALESLYREMPKGGETEESDD